MSRRKIFEPLTIPLQQKKVVVHRQFVGKGKQRKLENVQVPVYMGQSAAFMRYEKSQMRRRNRLAAEKDAKHPRRSAKVEVPDELLEELTDDDA